MSLFRIFCIIFMLGVRKVSTYSDWTISLKNHVAGTIKPFQLLFLISDDLESQDPQIEDMIKKIGERIPAMKLSYKNQTMLDIRTPEFFLSLKNPRATTLFVIIHYPADEIALKQLEVPIKFVIKISPNRSRPKCLMVLSTRNKSLNYKKLLQFMWSEHFLDATVLEVFKNNTLGTTLEKNWNQKLGSPSIVKVNYYNPFTGKLKKKRYSSKTRIFPNKLKDMHGYEMKAALIDSPPFSYVKRNLTGHPIETRGPDVLMSEALSSKMNFRLSLEPTLRDEFGKSDCDKTKTTGAMYDLSHNRIQFIANLLGMVNVCAGNFTETTLGHDFLEFVILAPKSFKIVQISYLDPWKCALPIILIGLVTIIVQTMGKILNFHAAFRSWFHILQPLLGITSEQTPRKPRERIIFVCLLITGITHISLIFSSLSEATIRVNSRTEIENLAEFHESGFKLHITPVLLELFSKNSEGIRHEILQQAYKKNSTDEQCLDLLVKFQNMSCIMRLAKAQSILANSTKEGSVQIVKQSFMMVFACNRMEPASPYVDRFNEIIQGVVQSGLYDKWKGDFTTDAVPTVESDQSAREELSYHGIFLQVLIFMITGYTVSLNVFLGELVLRYWPLFN